MDPLPKRSRPNRVESHFDRAGRGAVVFVTVCTRNRKPILANDAAHRLLTTVWRKADAWHVGRYVLMPDHIHFFCSPTGKEPYSDLKTWISYWKNQASKRWPIPEQKNIWQQGYWDRDLRSAQAYEAKWNYVFENPVRQSLVADAKDWPFQGEINVLEW